MNRISRWLWRTALLVAMSPALMGSSIQAQDVLDELYGQGVHAFFAGDLAKAQENLTQAIEAGSLDPRVHYFRGLAMVRSQAGSIEAGQPDFEKGAQLEILGKRSADVSRALTRVQGQARIAIEKARTAARVSSKSAQFELMKKRYEQANAAAATNAGVGSAAPAPRNPAPASDATDPFARASGLADGDATAMPAADSTDAPAGDAPGKDPFADEPADPAMNEEAPAEEADPFGADSKPAPADDDPFGS